MKKHLLRFIAGANVVTILLMLFTGYSGYLSPASVPLLGVVNFFYPLLLGVNLLFLILWAVVKLRGTLIPLVGFLLSFPSLHAYLPLNGTPGDTIGTLKFMSYNVELFSSWDADTRTSPAIDYIRREHPDILCIQEMADQPHIQKAVHSQLAELYPYSEIVRPIESGVTLALYSSYPIRSSEVIPFVSRANASVAFQLDIDGKETIVINNHLETVGLSAKEREDFRNIIDGKADKDATKQESKLLIGKLSQACAIRAKQADAVAQYIKEHQNTPIICCGDFNDGPLSYTHHTIARHLTDCFVSKGNGVGWSYFHHKMYVRIDNILCSAHWEPVRCIVDSREESSDHHPVLCWFKK